MLDSLAVTATMQMDYCGNSPRRFLWDATEAATIVDAAPDRDSNIFFLTTSATPTLTEAAVAES